MSYSRPDASSADFAFAVGAYSRPDADDADLAFAQENVGAVTLDVSTDAAGAHGVAATGALTLDMSADAVGDHHTDNFVAEGDATLTFDAAAIAGHGVAAIGAITLTIGADAIGAHGVAAATSAATLGFTAAAVALHPRHEVRGEVRLEGVLVDRRVRVYLRGDGSLVNEQDTVAGQFAIHTGFTAVEHYLLPIDLSDDARDWLPPVANRVAPTLVVD